MENESTNTSQIEVIEIKMDVNGEPEENFYEEIPEYEDENYDIANIPMSEDTPAVLMNDDENSFHDPIKNEKLDSEEMAILEKDLNMRTDGFEHLQE